MAVIVPRLLVIVGGTWEKQWGLLGTIVNATGEHWRPTWVDYPASYGTPENYMDSEDRGVTTLVLTLRRLAMDAEIAILGFSQGAAIVEKALRFMKNAGTISNRQILNRIRYVGLLGNPYRAPGDQVGPDPGGFGVIGPLALKGDTPIRDAGAWQNFALPGDLIAACPMDSLVRLIYPLTRYMSVQTPSEWARDVAAKASLVWVYRNLPELRDLRKLPLLIRRIDQAAKAAAHYQTSGIHGQYMIRGLGPNQDWAPAGRHIIRSLEEIQHG